MPSAAFIRQTWVVIEAALSFAGAGIAGVLWWQDRTAGSLPCTSNGGCEIVWTSSWSHIDIGPLHEVPVALLGLLGYVLLLSFAMFRLASESEKTSRNLHRLTWLVSAGGTVYSWYLQWVAHYKIGHFCIWCRTSAILMTLIFLLATYEYFTSRKSDAALPVPGRGSQTGDA